MVIENLFASDAKQYPAGGEKRRQLLCGKGKNMIYSVALFFPLYSITDNNLPEEVILTIYCTQMEDSSGTIELFELLPQHRVFPSLKNNDRFKEIAKIDNISAQNIIELDITLYCRSHKRIPRCIYLFSRKQKFEIWPPDEFYPYFSPRLKYKKALVKEENKPAASQLQSLLKEKPRQKIIIFPPTIDWNMPLFQRPQQLALAFSRRGYKVFYMTLNNKYDAYPFGFHRVEKNLFIARVSPEEFKMITQPILFISWVINSKYLLYFNNPYVIYDYIDELEIFHLYDYKMEEAHRFMLRTANLVTATAYSLKEKALETADRVLLCPNGVDYETFAAGMYLSEVPEDIAVLTASSRPIIGYYGALANWFDYDLLKKVAAQKKEYTFLLIGLDYDGSISRSGILNLENIIFLGPKPYMELPRYLKFFDVAVIPFLINNITVSTNPIKMYEYMAAGKPVVATELPECELEPGVLTAHSSNEFVRQLEHALLLKNNKNYILGLRKRAKENTWDSRVLQFAEIINREVMHNEKSITAFGRFLPRWFL